jgi:hypothetical protein
MASRDISERTREQLETQVETAFAKSLTMWQDGYRQSITLPNGHPCEPGVLVITRPVSVIRPGELSYYLCALYLVDQERRGPDDWHYHCDCPFYQRTERVLGRGQCKHGMWALRTFLADLERRPRVEHILSALPPTPTPAPVVERTARIAARPYVLPPGAIPPPVPPTQPFVTNGGQPMLNRSDITTAVNRPTVHNIAREGDFN